MLTHARGGCVVHRSQNKNPTERLTCGCEWRHAPEACARRISGKKSQSVSWVETRHRTRRDDFRGSKRPDEFARYGRRTRWGGGGWQSQNRKNVYLSPDVDEPLNSKVIKSFVTELRSRKCFSCFEILCSIYIYIYMNIICPFRITVSGYGTEQQWQENKNGMKNNFMGISKEQKMKSHSRSLGHG